VQSGLLSTIYGRPLPTCCLIEGEYSVFPVTVGHDCVTGTLRQKIKQERAITFKNVDAFTLELWKVIAINESLSEVTLAYSRRSTLISAITTSSLSAA